MRKFKFYWNRIKAMLAQAADLLRDALWSVLGPPMAEEDVGL